MARRAQLYVPLAINFFRDAKVLEAGEEAVWLYLRCLVEAKALDTDGVFTARQIASLGVPDWSDRLDRLIEVGLMSKLPDMDDLPHTSLNVDHYGVVGWLNWNESRDEREARLQQDRETKKAIKATSGKTN